MNPIIWLTSEVGLFSLFIQAHLYQEDIVKKPPAESPARIIFLLSKSGVGKGTVIPNTAARYTAFVVTVAVLKIFAVRYYGTHL